MSLDNLVKTKQLKKETSEYEGNVEFDDQLLEDLLTAANVLLERIEEILYQHL